MTTLRIWLTGSLLTVSAALADTWTGTIVDVMCKGKDLSSHTSKCAVMPNCAKSGTKIKNGGGGMPVYNTKISEEDIGLLSDWLNSKK